MKVSRSRVLVGAVMAVAVFVVSCGPPLSKNPLSDPKTAVADGRLKGLWVGTTGNADATLQLFPKAGAFFDLVLAGDDGDKGAAVVAFEGFPSQIGGKSYLNIRAKKFTGDYGESSEVSDEYIFARYEFAKDGSLTIWAMEDDLVEADVKAGKLEGTIVSGEIRLTASSETLAEYVKNADPAKLFHEIGTFRRVPVPAPAPAKKKK